MAIKRLTWAMRRESDGNGGLKPPDLFLDESGNLAMAYDAQAVGMHVGWRLKTYGGEWFLDRAAGVPWLRDILGKHYDPVLAESVIKGEILRTDGVSEITSFSVQFDNRTRGLFSYEIEVLTVYDQKVEFNG